MSFVGYTADCVFQERIYFEPSYTYSRGVFNPIWIGIYERNSAFLTIGVFRMGWSLFRVKEFPWVNGLTSGIQSL